MKNFLKVLAIAFIVTFVIVYFISPIDFCPGVIDDGLIGAGGLALSNAIKPEANE